MKTPDDIKKGLRCESCDECPYFYLRGHNCAGVATVDALVYMNQLENKIRELTAKVAQLEAAKPKWIYVHSCPPNAKF